MKTWSITFGVCCILLSGCAQSTSQPAITPTLQESKATIVQSTQTPIPLPVEEETPTVVPEVESIPSLSPETEALKNEWRPAIQNAIILFAACESVYETHVNAQDAEIDLDKAKSELAIEADFISFARWDDPIAYENETVAELMLRLETQMGKLIVFVPPLSDAKIGSENIIDSLSPVCDALNNLQSEVIFAAFDAGLSEEMVDEIDPSSTELFSDFWDMLN
ncbi:MAG: hypothetical protein JEZ00_19670 [Anaerolineaceae bacterium]|nr:hypothetical protein [Anaerolineaceae bacterium]